SGKDLPMLVETLVAAFVDDPVMTWCIPDAHRRPQILRAIFEIAVDVNQPYGELYTTDPVPVAGAVWVPPGCQPSGEHAEQLAASSEGNRRLYRRHGFEVTAEIKLPDGPTMWPMWREPSNTRGQR